MKNIIKRVMPLSFIVGLRFFGLFIVLSVISQYVLQMPGGTPLLAGLALGGYALTQAFLQVPFGVASDKFGRRKTIFIGLLIFAIGSVVAALADNAYMLILGRLLQGAGAIGSVVTAMISDQVREDERAHAMAVMGMVIALSFALSMIFGPLIAGIWSVSTIFWMTAFMSLLAIFILYTAVPEPPRITHLYSEQEAKVKHVFQDKDLMKMYITFLFHSSTMAMAFFLIPIIMREQFDMSTMEFWKVYLPAVFFGILAMAPAAIFGEKYGKGKEVFLVSIVCITLSFILMGFSTSVIWFAVGAVLFFIGFNMFEPLLQSFVSKFAKVHQKGAALGVANTFAYIGIFVGGVLAGALYQAFGKVGVSLFVIAVTIVWFIWILGMRNPALRANLFLDFETYDQNKLSLLKDLDGLNDYYINKTEQIIVVKYDVEVLNKEKLQELLKR